jgi:hypothetical protein
MPLLVGLTLGVSLAICFIPVCLLRHKTYARAQDYFVCSRGVPPSVIQNASIAYTPGWQHLSVLLGCKRRFLAHHRLAFCGLGLYLIYVLRQPMLGFSTAH